MFYTTLHICTVWVDENVRKYYKIVDKLGAMFLSASYDPLTTVMAGIIERSLRRIPEKSTFLLAHVYRCWPDNADTRAPRINNPKNA